MTRTASKAGADIKPARFAVNDRVHVLDEDRGTPVAPGTGDVGLVAVTGPIPIGYYKDEAKTAATFRTVDGIRYSIPGDYATVDVDGTIQLLGRGSACINTGGEKVYPEEVELVLREHPAVADCLVVGVPDERFGEMVVALVVAADGDGSLDEDALEAWCRGRVSGYKRPRRFFVVTTLDRSPAGKADYARLRARSPPSSSPRLKPACRACPSRSSATTKPTARPAMARATATPIGTVAAPGSAARTNFAAGVTAPGGLSGAADDGPSTGGPRATSGGRASAAGVVGGTPPTTAPLVALGIAPAATAAGGGGAATLAACDDVPPVGPGPGEFAGGWVRGRVRRGRVRRGGFVGGGFVGGGFVGGGGGGGGAVVAVVTWVGGGFGGGGGGSVLGGRWQPPTPRQPRSCPFPFPLPPESAEPSAPPWPRP